MNIEYGKYGGWSGLEPEILVLIFTKLADIGSVHDISSAEQVCRSWNSAAYSRDVLNGACWIHELRQSKDRLLDLQNSENRTDDATKDGCCSQKAQYLLKLQEKTFANRNYLSRRYDEMDEALCILTSWGSKNEEDLMPEAQKHVVALKEDIRVQNYPEKLHVLGKQLKSIAYAIDRCIHEEGNWNDFSNFSKF